MRIALSTLSLGCILLPMLAQSRSAAADAPQKEMLDTAEAGAAAPYTAPAQEPAKGMAPSAADSATVAADTASSAPAPRSEGIAIRNALLSRLDLSGTVQLKALYHDMYADRDADKSLSLQLRRFKLELDGGVDAHFGFRGEMLVDGNGRNFGMDNAYLYYTVNELIGFRGGKQKRPFSQEALQSSKSLYTVERGELYQNFLANTTGYSSFDIGLSAYGGFTEDGQSLAYEFGVFNGKQNQDPAKDYSGQQNENLDKGFKAKDLAMRLSYAPVKPFKLEAAVSTKAAEDTADAFAFGYAVNTAYEVGAAVDYKQLRLLGETSWGDNHKGLDAKIIDGSTKFLTFYLMGVWHETYTRGRASELVLKWEALDPDLDTDNDGRMRTTVGVNYFFTPQVSILADYGLLKPITKVAGAKDSKHDLDLLWRMNF